MFMHEDRMREVEWAALVSKNLFIDVSFYRLVSPSFHSWL